MIETTKPEAIKAVGDFLRRIRFDQVLKSFRFEKYYMDPWPHEKELKGILPALPQKYQVLYNFFILGQKISKPQFIELFGELLVENLLEIGFAKADENEIYSDGYSILSCNDLFLLVDAPFYYANCKQLYAETYIGADSLRLSTLSDKRNYGNVLDLCAGSGIQGLLLANTAQNVVSVELNPIAYEMIKVNSILNGLSDKMQVRNGSLYDVLTENETFDYILTNPPFVAVPTDMEYPMCGDGGPTGLDIVKQVLDGYPKYLNEDGRATMILEALGDDKEPFLIEYLRNLASENNLDVLVILHARHTIEAQTDIIVDLAAKLNDVDSTADLKNKWRRLYDKLGATFLYCVTIDCYKTKAGHLDLLNYCNPWTTQNIPKVTSGFDIKEYSKYYGVWREGRRTAVIDEDAYNMLGLLDGKKTLQEIAEEIHHTGSDTKSYSETLSDIMNVCLLLESCRLIKRL